MNLEERFFQSRMAARIFDSWLARNATSIGIMICAGALIWQATDEHIDYAALPADASRAFVGLVVEVGETVENFTELVS